jgi:hypothetical protein
MASEKQKGIVFLLIGIIIFILALSADFIGWGNYPGYGYKQIGYFIVGTIFIIAGVYLIKEQK